LVLGLFSAGCGGSTEQKPTLIGDRVFVGQANEICAKANGEAGSAILEAYDLREIKKSSLEGEAVDFEETIFAPILIKDAVAMRDGIGRLEVSSDDEAKVEALLEAYESWVEAAKASPHDVVIASDVFSEARRLARGYGLVQCATSPYEIGG
jgi:hypothetical protein